MAVISVLHGSITGFMSATLVDAVSGWEGRCLQCVCCLALLQARQP